MTSFIAAYVLVWLGAVAYVSRLAARQRHLEQLVESLHAEIRAAQASQASTVSRAA